jgi:TusA-related sulfurtransferase
MGCIVQGKVWFISLICRPPAGGSPGAGKPMNREHALDLRHLLPPLAILQMQQALKGLCKGDLLEIVINDRETCLDIKRVLSKGCMAGHQVRRDGDGWRIVIWK